MRLIVNIPLFDNDNEFDDCLREMEISYVEKMVVDHTLLDNLKTKNVYAAFITVSVDRLFCYEHFSVQSYWPVVGAIIQPNLTVMHMLKSIYDEVSKILGRTKGGGPATVVVLTGWERLPDTLTNSFVDWVARDAWVPSSFIYSTSRSCTWDKNWVVKDLSTCKTHTDNRHPFTDLTKTIVKELMRSFEYQ